MVRAARAKGGRRRPLSVFTGGSQGLLLLSRERSVSLAKRRAGGTGDQPSFGTLKGTGRIYQHTSSILMRTQPSPSCMTARRRSPLPRSSMTGSCRSTTSTAPGYVDRKNDAADYLVQTKPHLARCGRARSACERLTLIRETPQAQDSTDLRGILLAQDCERLSKSS
jgi:hypothetical protein